MADFLLELLSEEIPARMQAKARNDLSRLFSEALGGAGLNHGAIAAYSTPRRLALIVREVAEATGALSEEVKGPRTSAPAQALDGFLRKTGLTRELLEDRDGIWFAKIERPGREAGEVFQAQIPSIIFNFPWPKSMRWGNGDLRWVRPLHNVMAFLGNQHIEIDLSKWADLHVGKDDPSLSKVVPRFSNVTSLPQTLGHRFHHPGPITIGGAADYVEKLRACHVIVDQDEREAIIRDGAAKAAKKAKLALIEDEVLVAENAGLTEWPVPLLGEFDPDFLDVPREVIVLTMRTNQKYFACTNDQGLLAPAFVCVANIDASDGGKAIVDGNRRVLAARLADARFFWEQDLKIPLEEQAKKLDGIVFHEKLGTLSERSQRMASLIDDLSRYFDSDHSNARRAAQLAKSDLVTGMVGEFPELQGIVGGYLAEAQGEPKGVADAIRDHYGTPTEPASIAVALADKLDTLVGFFGIEQLPTGSKDPFALRRAALSAIRLITGNGLRIRLLELFPGSAQLYRNTGHTVRDAGSELLDFFADRLKVQQREAGVRHDLIDAVFALGGEDDLVRLLARVTALQKFVETDEGTNLLTAYKRAANILKKEDWKGSEGEIARTGEEDPLAMVDDPALRPVIEAKMAERHAKELSSATELEEQALIAALDTAEPKAAAAIAKEDFTGAMAALASLRGPIDAFFNHVTVNDPDDAKREHRLNLLMRFRDAVNQVADFSKIEG